MLTGSQIRQKYLDFFQSKGHVVIPSAPLVPENDSTTLFTGSGMQPMIPYLLGQSHPLGTRLVDSQKCFRSQDIEEVGDNRHDSFFEMLGNWSLGDYFKKEQQTWIWEFLTHELGLSPQNLFVSVFEGNDQIPRDEEAVNNWLSLGVSPDHIFYYGVEKNWWARSSYANMPIGEPGGPDSEIFYEFTQVPHNPKYGKSCHPNCDCGRFLEIGNSVFMTYLKTDKGFIPLHKKNIDFGGGLERMLAAVHNDPDIFTTDLYFPIIKQIETNTEQLYQSSLSNRQAMRIIADHLKAATFLIADGVVPSNKAQGYFLRRLLRRSMIKIQNLKHNSVSAEGDSIYNLISEQVINIYRDSYPGLFEKKTLIQGTLSEERDRFGKTLSKGLKEFNKLNSITGKNAFDLFQSYGFPWEVTLELATEKGQSLNRDEFNAQFSKHQELSRTASSGMFKGGLADHSEITTKYHTATHLLQASLRRILGNHVQQKGSNITSERLRFDFSHSFKMTPEQITLVEDLINQKITDNIPVTRLEMPKSEALAQGAMAFFPEKYPEVTSVYKIADFSLELCGGPHVGSTGEIGRIKITKEESAGAGIRRIYLMFNT